MCETVQLIIIMIIINSIYPRRLKANSHLAWCINCVFVCILSEPFGSLLQGSGGAADAAPADRPPSPPTASVPPPSGMTAAGGTAAPASGVGLAMRHNSMPHAEPWFHGRISRQKVCTCVTVCRVSAVA